MPKYLCLLESGRDFVLDSPYLDNDPEDVEQLAWDAVEEAAYMDDYLLDIRRIHE